MEKRMAEATPSGRGLMEGLNRIYRIEEDLSHARLTLHAASALKTQSRQGRGIEDYLFTSVQRARKRGGRSVDENAWFTAGSSWQRSGERWTGIIFR